MFRHTRWFGRLCSICQRCGQTHIEWLDQRVYAWQRGHVCGRNASTASTSRPLAAAQHENDHSPTPTHQRAGEATP